MKKTMNLVLEEEGIIELIRILIDDDAEGAGLSQGALQGQGPQFARGWLKSDGRSAWGRHHTDERGTLQTIARLGGQDGIIGYRD